MKIEKLPSGSYRIRKMYQGKIYTIITETKPSQKEALLLLAQEIENQTACKKRMSFFTAAEEYCKSKDGLLSPSTLRGYKTLNANISPKFGRLILNDITASDIQVEINLFAKQCSLTTGKPHAPKTIRNYHGFISAVLGLFRPNFIFRTTLPCKQKKSLYIPSDEDIRRILEYVHNTIYEIPFLLAIFGLRRSEICGLAIEDFTDAGCYVRNVKVQGENGKWIIKDTTKTPDGTRFVPLPPFILERIKHFNYQGSIFTRHPNRLYQKLRECQDALEIPPFKLHGLRHYFASTSRALGIPMEYVMTAGGWSSPKSMQPYDHALSNWQTTYNERFGSHISSIAKRAGLYKKSSRIS